jgi:hypothetical protein
MIATLIFALLGGADQPSSQPCTFPHVLHAEHDGNYGPGWTGPSFRFEISPQGHVKLKSRRWVLPDGDYEGAFLPDDWRAISCLLATQAAAMPAVPKEIWACAHTPRFTVTDPEAHRWVSRCVEDVDRSPLADLYSLLAKVPCRARWDAFTAAPPGPTSWLGIASSPTPCAADPPNPKE